MRLWRVDHVVDPPKRLLHADGAPLGLVQEAVAGHVLCQLLWQDHVPTRPRPVSAAPVLRMHVWERRLCCTYRYSHSSS